MTMQSTEGVTGLKLYKGNEMKEDVKLFIGNKRYAVYKVEGILHKEFVPTTADWAANTKSFAEIFIVYKEKYVGLDLGLLYKDCKKKSGHVRLLDEPKVPHRQNIPQIRAVATPYVARTYELPEPPKQAAPQAIPPATTTANPQITPVNLNDEKYRGIVSEIIAGIDIGPRLLKFSEQERAAILALRAFTNSIYKKINKGELEIAGKELEGRLKKRQEPFFKDLHQFINTYRNLEDGLGTVLKSVNKAEPIKDFLEQKLMDYNFCREGIQAELNSDFIKAKEAYDKINDPNLKKPALERLGQGEVRVAQTTSYYAYVDHALTDGSFTLEDALAHVPVNSAEGQATRMISEGIDAYQKNNFAEAKKILSSDSIKKLQINSLTKLFSEINKAADIEKQIDCGELAAARKKIDDLKPLASAFANPILQNLENAVKNIGQVSDDVDNWCLNERLIMVGDLPGKYGETLKKVQNSLEKARANFSEHKYMGSKNSLAQAFEDARTASGLDIFKRNAKDTLKQLDVLADVENAFCADEINKAKNISAN